ncbi:MAG TPA: M13 family metallopeptidase [Vicinamibacterales bacterium]|nr:M13 family metallopeptidase [Vicinamibacterales bacterium]
MTRRLISTAMFVALPLAAILTITQTRIRAQQPSPPAPPASPAPPAPPALPALPAPPALSSSGLQLDALDKTADACTDFYQFACGGWIAKNPVPSDRASWGRFEELQERNNETLHRILEAAAAGRDPESKKIGDYYASCMDETAIDARGAAPLDPLLKKIAAVTSVADLAPLVAELHTVGVNVFFQFGSQADFKDASVEMAIADQGGLGLPDRDYYFKDDAKSVDLRTQYLDHIARMSALLGAADNQAKASAQQIMNIETALAKNALDAVSRRDPNKVYHKMSNAELQALTPQFPWNRYFTGIGSPPVYALNVAEPDFIKGFGQLLGTTPLDQLKAYLRWQVAHASAAVLAKPFVDENFRFFGTALTGAKELRPRWKRCVQYTDSDLGEALGQAFVKEAFGPQAKADTLKMVHELESALENDINGLAWMTPATKKEALVKLHAIADKIGYPDRWRDYSALSIVRGDALGNSQRSNAFEFHRQMAKIGKPVDKTLWLMTPPTVNAYYNPLENNINFPAGILQPPFYSAKADAAINFGGSGAVIGHELTHGFDDQGRQFDARGNLKDWWTPADAKSFEDRAQCLVDEYSGFTAIDDVKLNGKLTLGENTADNGGLRIALMAYLARTANQPPQTLDGFRPEQRVFLGWGQVWCENVRPERARMLAQINPHSPGHDRVNGVVSNMPEFQKAFACKADAPMVRKNQCRVW